MDPITGLAGMLDTSAFNEGADAFGTKVSEEYMQIINKLNDSITGLNEVAVDQIADGVLIADNTTSITFNAASILDLEVLAAANTVAINDNADDIAALQRLDKIYGSRDMDSNTTITVVDLDTFSFLQCYGAGAGGTTYLILPDPDLLDTGRTVTVYSTRPAAFFANLHDDDSVLLDTGDSVECTVIRDNGDTENIWAAVRVYDAS